MFDMNGDGMISRQEFRLGFNSLEIGLSYDEIDDLMRMISSRGDGRISYDDFIQKMDANIRHRRNILQPGVDDAVFKKLSDCLQYQSESLYDSLKTYDVDDSGTILRHDLVRVFKRLGLSTIEPHLPLILQTGGAGLKDERIDIASFSIKMMAEVEKRAKQTHFVKTKFMQKIHSMLRAKGLSLFDIFVKMDVNGGGDLSRIELKTGMQALGITITREEFDLFWKTIRQPVKTLTTQQAGAGSNWGKRSLGEQNKPKAESVSYLDLIKAFIDAGCIKFEKSTDRSNTLMAKYRQQLKKIGKTPDAALKIYDDRGVRFVFKNDFIDTSLSLGFEFSQEELLKIFEIICEQGTKQTEST
jgi:Ca2+-binding EF-hand superfamily protein